MEVTRSSETSVYIKPTQHHIPEDGINQYFFDFLLPMCCISMLLALNGMGSFFCEKYVMCIKCILMGKCFKALIAKYIVLFSKPQRNQQRGANISDCSRAQSVGRPMLRYTYSITTLP
jgi:hypothetical protein